MEYHVIPFSANISSTGDASNVASKLQHLIDSQTADGWEYVRLEQVETHVAGDDGCFGIGATPPKTISVSLAVFQR